MDLDPDYIKENLEQIGKKEGLNLLREWIDNSTNSELRQTALKNYGLIDNGKNFKFFENLFLSDEDHNIRLISGKILREKYSNNKKLIALLAYTINKGDNIEQRLFAIKTLISIENSKARKLVIESFQCLIKSEFKTKIIDVPKEIYNYNYIETIPKQFQDIFINLILTNYYIHKCGYHVTLRKGKIISLNCESSTLNSVSEIKGLSSLNNLEHIYLQRNNLNSLEGFHFLKKVRTLDLSHNNIIKIESLGSFDKLEDFDLSNNKIQKIEGLKDLKSLRKLALNNNLIYKIENLESLSNLEELDLSHNGISKIENLDKLDQLKKLNLSFNQINKITGLELLKKLMWLYLNNNRISQIEGLSTLENLKGLYLSNNLIEDIQSLDHMINLKKLELSNNKIRKLYGLKNLSELQELYIDNNMIQKLEDLDNLDSLIILHLGSNNISEFSNESIKNLKNLNFIFLNENPLDQKSIIEYHKKLRFP